MHTVEQTTKSKVQSVVDIGVPIIIASMFILFIGLGVISFAFPEWVSVPS